MPRVNKLQYYNGAEERISRLGLAPLWQELLEIISGFELLVKEERDANGGAVVRELIDGRFADHEGWTKKQTGGVDWTKCINIDGARVCIGVEVQFSGRSDLLVIDVTHLREQITAGALDVGVIVTSSDELGVYLTDRGPRYSDAVRAIERCKAEDSPLALVALEHDGPGPPLPKKRTRQGKATP